MTVHSRPMALLLLGALCFGAGPAAAESASVDGVELPYRSIGSGPLVVFVHGALGDRRVWDATLDALAELPVGHRYVAYTQRHFGPGEGPLGMPEDFTRETHVADLIGFVEALDGGAPTTLVTWSYGGEIAVHAMRRRPDLFRAAVHVEPILFPLLAEIPGGERARLEKVRTVFAPAGALARDGDLEGAAMRFVEGIFLMPPGGAAEAPAPWPEIWRDNSRTIPAYGAMSAMPVACADLAAISAPTLIVQGAETQVDAAMMADQVARCLPNAIAVTVTGVNHDLPMRDPARVASIVSGFLAILD